MMLCQDIDGVLVDYLYGELDAARTVELEGHVQGCTRCSAEVGSLQRTRQAMRALPELEPAPAVTTRLLHEASKRAPRVVAEGGGLFGWLGRFFQPLVAHPAWAAGASFTVVVGLVAVLTRTGKVRPDIQSSAFEDRAASAPAAADEPARPGSTPAAPQPAAAASGELAVAPASAAAPPAGSVAAADKPRAVRAPGTPPAQGAGKVAAPAVVSDPREQKPYSAKDAEAALGRRASSDEQQVIDSVQKKRPPRAKAEAIQAPGLDAGDDGYAVALPAHKATEVRAPAAKDAAPSEPSGREVTAIKEAPKPAASPGPAEETGVGVTTTKVATGAAQAGGTGPRASAPPVTSAPPAPAPRPNAEAERDQRHAEEKGDYVASDRARAADAKQAAEPPAPKQAPAAPAAPRAQNELAKQAPAAPAEDRGKQQTAQQAPAAPADNRGKQQTAQQAQNRAEPPAQQAQNRADQAPAVGPREQQQAGPGNANANAAPDGEQANTRQAAQNEAPEQRLYQQARQQAAGGRCADALTIAQRIAKMNPDFYRRRVAGDATLESCATPRRKGKVAAPARAGSKVENLEDSAADKAAK